MIVNYIRTQRQYRVVVLLLRNLFELEYLIFDWNLIAFTYLEILAYSFDRVSVYSLLHAIVLNCIFL